MIDITLENFQTALVDASVQQPVLLNIVAPWSAQCQELTPILAQLEQDYAGSLRVANLDADAVPQIAQQLCQMFGVSSVPLCVIFKGGQPVDGFAGVLSAPEIGQFLAKHLPAVADSAPQEKASELQQALDSGDLARIEQQLVAAVAEKPTDINLRFDCVKFLLQQQKFSQAEQVLNQAGNSVASSKLQALQDWLTAQNLATSGVELAQLEAALFANKRDYAARYQKAQLLMAATKWCEAMDELAEILLRDKKWQDGAARKLFLAILEIIEPPVAKVEEGKIPPQDPVVTSYRRLLSSIILS